MPCPDAAEFRIHLEWNIHDTGPVETVVRQALQNVDRTHGAANGVGNAPTRAAAMVEAIDSAKNKFDQKAFDISIACQLHPGGCAASLSNAGVWAVAQYLRSK
jgi:hypothetical protein